MKMVTLETTENNTFIYKKEYENGNYIDPNGVIYYVSDYGNYVYTDESTVEFLEEAESLEDFLEKYSLVNYNREEV